MGNAADRAVVHAALVAGLETKDNAALKELLGPGSTDLISSGDEVADQNVREDFLVNSGLDRFYVEELEKDYFQLNRIENDILEEIRK